MRFIWNEGVASWEAVVSPGDVHEAGAGPVGPAGVSVLRIGNASVSICTMTGRVTSALLPSDPDERERALYEVTFGRPLDPGLFRAEGGDAFEDEVLPVADRMAVVRWAHLGDTIKHVEFRPDVVAEFLAQVEYAAALCDVRSLGREGELLVSATEAAESQAFADRVAERAETHSGGVAGVVAVLGGESFVADAVKTQFTRVRDSMRNAGDLSIDPWGRARLLIDDLIEELSMSFLEVLTLAGEDVSPALEVSPDAVSEKPALGRWATHGAADAASRAGLVALQRARAGEPTMKTVGQLIFAEASVAWRQLGAEFKADWAWQEADHDEARALFESAGLRGQGGYPIPASSTEALPTADQYLISPLWVFAEPIKHLLPSASGTELNATSFNPVAN